MSTDKLLFGKEGEEVARRVDFKTNGANTVLQKEAVVRRALDELNGVTHNEKTNEVWKRAFSDAKHVRKNLEILRGTSGSKAAATPKKEKTVENAQDDSIPAPDAPEKDTSVSDGKTIEEKRGTARSLGIHAKSHRSISNRREAAGIHTGLSSRKTMFNR